MRIRTALVASLILLSLAGCASSSVQNVPMPSQAVPLTSRDVARVYVARKSDVRGSLRSVRVFDGDKEIGTINTDDFLCWERAPGRTLLRCYYEGVSIGVGDTEGLIDLRAEAGHRYVYGIGLSYSDRKPEAELLSDRDADELLASRSPAKVR